MLDQEILKLILSYDPETGQFTWLDGPRKGKIAGSLREDGYCRIGTGGTTYYAHRLAWLYVHGEWPAGGLDHRNLLTFDNRIDNLRPATTGENNRNVGLTCRNKSGVKGVSWNPVFGKWVAQCKVNGKVTYLGGFNTVEKAAEAYQAFAKERHGEFYRAL